MRPTRSTSLLSVLLCALALSGWAFFVVRSYQVFGPDSSYVQPFNSDSALPVLMANDPHIDSFRTYIYGQDQIGAWPFLFGQVTRRITGFAWTPHSIYLFQVMWLSLSLLLVATLCRECAWLSAALLAVTISLHPTVAHYFFVLNQKNAWQVTALFAAWVCLRRLLGRYFATIPKTRLPELLVQIAAFSFSLLAIWTSPASTPILCAFYALELLRAKIMRAHQHNAPRLTKYQFVKGFLPVLLAVLAEQMLKANYHRFALKHFGSDFKTPTDFDWGNILVNFRHQVVVLVSAPYWPLVVFAFVAAAVLLALLLRLLRRPGQSIATPGIRLDLSVLICGCAIAALVNFALTVPFTWVRLNGYGPRYLAQTHMFGFFAGLLTFALLFSLVAGVYRIHRVVYAAIAVLASVLTVFAFPAISRNLEYDKLQQIAVRLQGANPETVLLGGYWDTYVFAALGPPNRLIPLPAQDQLLRTPWTSRRLMEVERVVIVQHVFPATGEVEVPGPYVGFGNDRTPPATITQYGVTLRLDVPQWFEQNGYSFSVYNRVSR